ncbi:hypothetical protein D3C85_544740 [compost metagenome]
MAARLRQGLARAEEARAVDHAVQHGLRQGPIGPAGITHAGKAPVQHALHDGQCAQQRQGIRQGRHAAQVEGRRHHVHVAVDHARHQRHALGVHHLGVRHGQLVGADASDHSVFDQHIGRGFQGQRSGIQNLAILNNNRLHI